MTTFCRQCKSTSIKSRTNYPHGTKSRSRTTRTCNNCGSVDIEVQTNKFKRRK